MSYEANECVHDDGFYMLMSFLANCYKRVMDETQEMQKKIEEKLGLNPVEKEVVVLYDGETDKVLFNFRLNN